MVLAMTDMKLIVPSAEAMESKLKDWEVWRQVCATAVEIRSVQVGWIASVSNDLQGRHDVIGSINGSGVVIATVKTQHASEKHCNESE